MEIGEKQLADLTESCKKRYSRVSSLIVAGTPFLEIIRQARITDVDIIVIGTHGRSGLQHVIMGSVAEKVVRKAPCPVLTVMHPVLELVMP